MAIKCLLVEDEFIIANDIKLSLENNGFEVTAIIASGEEAIESVHKSKPDIILMDITLKGNIDGIEAMKQIYSSYDIPVIYLSANTDEKILERAQITEPFGYLIKPLDKNELLINVKMAFYKHSIDQRLKEINQSLDKRISEEVERNREKEMLLIQQSKMASIGEMIGAIAHQWRQPLNTVNLLAQDLISANEYGELNTEYLNRSVGNIMQQVAFMSNTIDDFKNFFKQDKEKTPFKLNSAIKEVIFLSYEQIKTSLINLMINCSYQDVIKKKVENIKDENICNCEPELMVFGYPNEFKQAVLNLIANSKDAIIESRNRGLYDNDIKPFISIEISTDDDKAIIKFKDNGGGIPDEIIEKIFYPYVTTKKEGTGIGLYMTRIIIEKNMGGTIKVKNIERGAEFIISLDIYKNGC